MSPWINKFYDYMLSIVEGMDAIEQATGEREINAAGYCLGGTILLTTLALATNPRFIECRRAVLEFLYEKQQKKAA
mgnify:CR=1 FL=1